MNQRRLTELDGLRGVAALVVVVFHYIYQYNDIYGHEFSVSELFRFGYYGVHLFFIISGFVIYWTIVRSDKPLDFIWSRFSRLYPVYWMALTITFLTVLAFSLPGRERELQTVLMNYTMFHEYFGYAHVDGVYWTLTLELAFYFWILLIFSLGQMRNIEKILIFWVSASALLTYYKFGIDISPNIKKIFLLDYIELFAAGICFYKVRSNEQTSYTKILLLLSCTSIFASYPTLTSVGLMSFYVLFFLVVFNKASLLRNHILVYLGTISYSLYLTHQNVGYVIINHSYANNLNPFVGLSLALIVSLFLAHWLMVLVEKPSSSKLRSYYKSNKKIQQIGEKLTLLSKR